MTHIIGWRALGGSGPGNFLFQGGDYDATVCIFAVDFKPGQGPRLHRHPYEEVFVVVDGLARFTVDGTEHDVEAGHVVVVPANTPHRFINAGETRLRMTSVQPQPRVETEWLEI
jgi:quercetin dioxygenase-like cupin family protein